MAQFSMEIMRPTGSVLRGNQQMMLLLRDAPTYIFPIAATKLMRLLPLQRLFTD